MVKSALVISALVALSGVNAASLPLEARQSSSERWSALFAIGKQADQTLKSLCRGVLAPITTTVTTTGAPTQTVYQTVTVPSTVTARKTATQYTTLDTTMTETVTETQTFTSVDVVVIETTTTAAAENLAKRDVSGLVTLAFNNLYRIDPKYVTSRCQQLTAPNTVTATKVTASAAPTNTVTVTTPVTQTVTDTVTAIAIETKKETEVKATDTTVVVGTTTTSISILPAPSPTIVVPEPAPAPTYPLYMNPISGMDARPVARLALWDGVGDGLSYWTTGSADECAELCSTQWTGCAWIFHSPARNPDFGGSCYARGAAGVSELFRADSSDIGSAVYWLGTCESIKNAGLAPIEALKDCSDSYNTI